MQTKIYHPVVLSYFPLTYYHFLSLEFPIKAPKTFADTENVLPFLEGATLFAPGSVKKRPKTPKTHQEKKPQKKKTKPKTTHIQRNKQNNNQRNCKQAKTPNTKEIEKNALFSNSLKPNAGLSTLH